MPQILAATSQRSLVGSNEKTSSNSGGLPSNDNIKASYNLRNYLKVDQGCVCVARTQYMPDSSIALSIRLAFSTAHFFTVTSELDVTECFILITEYCKTFGYTDTPLHFQVDFGRASYNIDDMSVCSSMPSELPQKVPEFWPGKKHTHESLEVFFGRVWARYLDVGLDMNFLEKRDKKLVNAIRNFKKNEGKDWPERYKLATNASRLAICIERAKKEGFGDLTPKELKAVLRKMDRTGIAIDPVPQRPTSSMSVQPRRSGVGWGSFA